MLEKIHLFCLEVATVTNCGEVNGLGGEDVLSSDIWHSNEVMEKRQTQLWWSPPTLWIVSNEDTK